MSGPVFVCAPEKLHTKEDGLPEIILCDVLTTRIIAGSNTVYTRENG